MKKVLFVCTDNACRSQMAEGFARRFGKGVIEARSAGTEPEAELNALAVASMRERGLDTEELAPKGLEALTGEKFDICVRFTGVEAEQLPCISTGEQRDWGDIADLKSGAYADYRRIREEIGSRVMGLLREFRGSA